MNTTAKPYAVYIQLQAAVNFSMHTGGVEKFILLWGGRHKKFAFSLEGGGGLKSFQSLFSPFTNPPLHK